MATIPILILATAVGGVLALATNSVLVRQFDPKGLEATARREAKAAAARQREIDRKRMIAGLGERMTGLLPIARAQQNDIEMQLTRAGVRMSAASYWGIMVLAAAGGLACGVLFAVLMRLPGVMYIPAAAVGLVLGLLIPRLWLVGKIRKRREIIEASLPGTLELLSVVVEAGQTVERGIKEIATRTEGPLAEEFARVDLEITKYNRRTADALQDMAARCDIVSVGMFCSSVAQAMEAGSAIGRILKSQAKIASENYYMAVEEKSNKISVKMIFPTIICLLPPILIISLAPTIIRVLDTIGSGVFS